MGRPKLQIDEDQVMKLAAMFCTMEEIASVVKCSVDTLENRFSDVIKEGRLQGKASLKRMMFKKCQEGNVTMMIWMSKNHLGYSEKETVRHEVNNEKLIIDLSGTYKP